MTLEVGTRVRSIVELMGDDGYLIPENSPGLVIGHEDDKVVVAFDLEDTTAKANVWELRRVKP